jgi:hypothetical protein
MFVNSLLPHLKYPLQQHNFSNAGIGSAGSPATRRKPISEGRSSHRGFKGGSEEINIPAEPEKK